MAQIAFYRRTTASTTVPTSSTTADGALKLDPYYGMLYMQTNSKLHSLALANLAKTWSTYYTCRDVVAQDSYTDNKYHHYFSMEDITCNGIPLSVHVYSTSSTLSSLTPTITYKRTITTGTQTSSWKTYISFKYDYTNSSSAELSSQKIYFLVTYLPAS